MTITQLKESGEVLNYYSGKELLAEMKADFEELLIGGCEYNSVAEMFSDWNLIELENNSSRIYIVSNSTLARIDPPKNDKELKIFKEYFFAMFE